MAGVSVRHFYPPRLVPSIEGLSHAGEFIQSIGDRHRGIAVIAYDAGTELKHVPPETIKMLCKFFGAEGFRIILIEGKWRPSIVHMVTSDCDAKLTVYPYNDSISDLIGLLSLSQLVVCPDTGIAHFAAALDVPSIVLFGPSQVAFRPAGSRSVVVEKSRGCSAAYGSDGCHSTCRHKSYVSSSTGAAACMYWFHEGDLKRALELALS
jgi:ADP-heptose:LPS heptosyltransferase